MSYNPIGLLEKIGSGYSKSASPNSGLYLASAMMLGAALSACHQPITVQHEPAAIVEHVPPKQYRLLGLQVQLPNGWAVLPDIPRLSGGKVITINNFESKYLYRGMLPAGGAEITLVADDSFAFLPSIDSLVNEFIEGDHNVQTKDININGAPCRATLVQDDSEVWPNVVYRRIVVFLPVKHQSNSSPVVYKAVMMFNATDNQETQESFYDTYLKVLQSLAIIEPVECDDVRIRI